jgi:hypothetical protein
MGDLLDIPIASSNSAPPDDTTVLPANSSNSIVITPPPPTPAVPAQAASAPVAIPDVAQMEQLLQDSGKLLNEIGINPQVKIDNSPLAALQPQNMLLTKTGPQPIRLPSEHEMPLLGINLASSGSGRHISFNFQGIGSLIFKWLLIMLFAGLGSFSALKTIRFFFLDFPQLEKTQALTAGVENQFSILLILNFIVLIAAIVLFGLAIQLIRSQTVSLKFLGLSLFVAAICVISQSQVNLNQAAKIDATGNQINNQTTTWIDSLLDMVPFLKRQEDGTVTPVWYKDVTEPY